MNASKNEEIPLHQQECVPCKGGTAPLNAEQIGVMYAKLGGEASGWEVMKDHHLQKVFTFDDYAPSVAFTDKIAALATRVDHHPSLLLEWGKVTVTLWTHKVDGLTESDFVFAAKTDKE